ncbi:MAG: STAS domain-containing protein [Spirochaetes bacterium]|nr:STAS domain-containing protein [Spirochaetota bacterium]
MNIDFTQKGTIQFIHIKSDIDLYNADRLKKTALELIEKKPEITHVCLDMGGVTFIDSSGMGILIMMFKSIKKCGKMFSFCNIMPNVDRLFEMGQVKDLFLIFNSIDDVH